MFELWCIKRYKDIKIFNYKMTINIQKALCIIRKYPPPIVIKNEHKNTIKKIKVNIIKLCPIWVRKNF